MAEITLIVHARSSKSKIQVIEGVAHIWVSAPPIEGAANEAVIALLAKHLGIPRRDLTIVRGASARHKRIAIEALSTEEIFRHLEKE
jgi:uncharacterized protein